MKITGIEVFDLFGDGTLVMKTNMDVTTESAKYAWYVYCNGKVIFKSPYQSKPFLGYKVENLGKYLVKAFVKDADEKVQDECEIILNKSTSPLLVNSDEKTVTISPVVENITQNFYRFDVRGDFDSNTTFAWYIYPENSNEPIYKQMYTKMSEYLHSFKESGRYYAKVFVMSNGVKKSAKTEVFSVEDIHR